MKRALFLLAVVAGGLLTGGGAAYAVTMVRPAQQEIAKAPEAELRFVPTGPILVPLVYGDGQLAGYASIDVQVQVPADEAEAALARMPLLLHAINLRTYRTPLAAGPDGQLPDLPSFRRLVMDAAAQGLGTGTVKHVAITQARPAP